jgi:hypothetical protein
VSSRRLRGGHTQQDPFEGGVLAARLCEGRRASRTREEFQVQMRVISKADLVRLCQKCRRGTIDTAHPKSFIGQSPRSRCPRRHARIWHSRRGKTHSTSLTGTARGNTVVSGRASETLFEGPASAKEVRAHLTAHVELVLGQRPTPPNVIKKMEQFIMRLDPTGTWRRLPKGRFAGNPNQRKAAADKYVRDA